MHLEDMVVATVFSLPALAVALRADPGRRIYSYLAANAPASLLLHRGGDRIKSAQWLALTVEFLCFGVALWAIAKLSRQRLDRT